MLQKFWLLKVYGLPFWHVEPPSLQALADEIVRSGAERPVVVAVDVTATEAHLKIQEAVYGALGGVDILANSAGGSRPTSWDAPEERWLEGMTVNFIALWRLTMALLPRMIESQWGRVINITGTSTSSLKASVICLMDISPAPARAQRNSAEEHIISGKLLETRGAAR